MIHYQLRCSRAHEFDGWFRDSRTFADQAKRGLLECPECGDVRIEQALMAPSIGGRAAEPSPPPAPPAPAPPSSEPVKVAAPTEVMPAQVRAMLQRLRAEVERNCDYVGERFADEARRIHRGETERRGIYGESTPDQVETLAEEGITVSRIPWVSRADG
ncbi:MAG TPA: DUF1178 family protein [Acetobacteraceae bacterium]|nr:DUF1178 family protein [Acetobacteraceae bacterium]